LQLLFGGSFDPVHRGHIDTARAAQALLGADSVQWLPTPSSPLKLAAGASAVQRADMLRLQLKACAEPSWQFSDAELSQATPVFTIETLTRWRQRIGRDAPLAFLIGADSLHSLPRWRDWQDLTKLAHIVIATRPGITEDWPSSVKIWLKSHHHSDAKLLQLRPFGAVLRIDTPARDISSTELRRRISENLPTDDWLAAPVHDYIAKHGLYRATETPAS
jgi:nicotinate-nucleotide adenylyltransferase